MQQKGIKYSIDLMFSILKVQTFCKISNFSRINKKKWEACNDDGNLKWPEMLPMLKENYEYKVTSKVKNKLLLTNVKVFDPDLVQL